MALLLLGVRGGYGGQGVISVEMRYPVGVSSRNSNGINPAVLGSSIVEDLYIVMRGGCWSVCDKWMCIPT